MAGAAAGTTHAAPVTRHATPAPSVRYPRLPGFYCSGVLVAIGRRPGTALTTPSTAAPARSVEQAAGLLAHQACRGDSGLATELIQLAFSVPTARRRPRLRLARSRAGLIGHASPAQQS